MYAHIFKFAVGFQLFITDTPELVGCNQFTFHSTKAAAKAAAKAAGAKAWNY